MFRISQLDQTKAYTVASGETTKQKRKMSLKDYNQLQENPDIEAKFAEIKSWNGVTF